MEISQTVLTAMPVQMWQVLLAGMVETAALLQMTMVTG
jgi:hypothetical protein